MSIENVQKFIAELAGDASILEAWKASESDVSIARVVELARGRGHDFTEEEFFSEVTKGRELSEAQLEAISGGAGHAEILDAIMAETIGMAMHNAVTRQHNAGMVSSASVPMTGVSHILKRPSS